MENWSNGIDKSEGHDNVIPFQKKDGIQFYRNLIQIEKTVSKVFNKRHDNVLRDIDRLIGSIKKMKLEEQLALNFEAEKHLDELSDFLTAWLEQHPNYNESPSKFW